MIGLIQKLLIEMISDLKGPETADQVKLLAQISTDKQFQMNNVYSDEEWQRLFKASQDVLNLTQEQVEELYADYFGKDVVKRFPTWFQMSKNSYELLSIQPTIHNCFATSLVDIERRKAITDKFLIEKYPNEIITHYRSPNKLCGLYKGLAHWVINYYKDKALIKENKCLKSGDDECEIHIQWTKLRN
ncbi:MULTISPECIES: heme NO-binding domain-containing protein [unclassified Legionella]|uniref:heme NO-binding domain-containing protein n=1 Tax=unclassified Legionella TaxID=2622702 RepID=UPI0010549293|nr:MULTISPECIES: heme NO-binding domain-containing protein [unclassified Legionella]MDI9819035.1 heme NO-binding domain-containing protein [Legionella sp. PL877]